jgi:hypothetical protein
LFRVPAAARQAAEPDAGAVLTASAEQSTASNPDMERFFRYALLYAQMRSEALQNEGGMMKVAAAPGSRLVLPAAKSRPSLLPQAIEIGAPVERSREAAAALAAIAGPAAVEPVATLEPQPIPVAAESEPERNVAALLAFTPAPPAVEVVATLEPQPILVHQALEPEDIRTLARQLAVAQPLAQSAPAVIVVAMAQQSATPAREEASNVKEVRIERRAPRFFTDYRGAVFHM